MYMIEAAFGAAAQALSPAFRAVLWKVLLLTLALLAGIWFGLDRLILSYLVAPWPWLQAVLSFLTGLGLVFGLAFAVAPVSILVAGFFLDDLAAIVEREDPGLPPGRPLPAQVALWVAAKFTLVSIAVNLFAVVVFLIPGVNATVFFVANAYLFGREYFELAAMRYHPIEAARALRRAHAAEVFFAGLFIAGFVAVPVLNLLTPLFGVAFMVRVHRAVAFPHGLPLPNPNPERVPVPQVPVSRL